MIKRSLIIALSLGLCHAISAQKITESQNDANSAKIMFNNTIHDFGKVVQYDPAWCEFRFYNKGKSPLIISDISASCGCTVPSWSKAPVMPGDSGIIQVNYATSETGTIDKVVDVFSNATKKPVSLKLIGKVMEK
jgi:hypothetical protein